ncbi:YeeE/YedE family protein [Synechococcus sp. PCC 7336]|uniref:YeeE/YedE family protein n=1 Tax=Synechococcus sp. PCC 7336 TaxID=195250 RepID=UPI00034CEB29|nr:YeeE/YedE family protein [Synechococcus sp. PCC 7336]
MKQKAIALISGLLFGFGLGLSQMIDRERVLGFLDIAGVWDPTLLFVLGGAVGVTLVAFRFVLRLPQPWFGDRFFLPTKTAIDRPLLVGAALFGIGWGIAGYCPGPGITALTLGMWNPAIFVLSAIAGSLTYRWISTRPHSPTQPPPSQSSTSASR